MVRDRKIINYIYSKLKKYLYARVIMMLVCYIICEIFYLELSFQSYFNQKP